MSEQTLSRIHVLTLVIIVFGAYFAVKDAGFVWDTIPFVLQNPWVHELNIDNLVAMFTQAHESNWHPPVVLSHAVDFYLLGDDSGKHHLMNLAYHIVNVILVYGLVICLLNRTHQVSNAVGVAWIAFLTAAIFGIHPQHVESVAWVVERKDVLYSLFTLACLIFYIRAYDAESHSHLRHVWPFLLFCVAISAKPMAVTIPVILILLDLYPLQRRQLSLTELLHAMREKSHYIVVAFAVVLITLNTQSDAMPDADSLPLWARTVNAIDNTWFYVAHYLWPVNLSPFYPYPQDAEYLASPAFWLPGILFLSATTLVCLILLYRNTTWPLLLLGFYLVTLLPVSGLVHVGPAKATDHYVYLATLPFSFLTGLAIVFIWQRFEKTKLLLAPLTIFYLTFLFLMTVQQVTYWNNSLDLWSRVVALHPESPFPHRNLASAYAHIEEWDLALQHAELSLQLGSPDEEYVIRLREKVLSDRSND